MLDMPASGNAGGLAQSDSGVSMECLGLEYRVG
jgi:hypothetical protein